MRFASPHTLWTICGPSPPGTRPFWRSSCQKPGAASWQVSLCERVRLAATAPPVSGKRYLVFKVREQSFTDLISNCTYFWIFAHRAQCCLLSAVVHTLSIWLVLWSAIPHACVSVGWLPFCPYNYAPFLHRSRFQSVRTSCVHYYLIRYAPFSCVLVVPILQCSWLCLSCTVWCVFVCSPSFCST